MIRRIFLLLFAFACAEAQAQESKVVIRGKVIDLETQAPISRVLLTVKNNKGYTYSSAEGEIFWTIVSKQPLKELEIQGRHTGYINATKIVRAKSGDTVDVRIEMIPFVFENKTIEISAENAPDSVWGSEQHHVGDFAFIDQGLLLLTYEKEDRLKREKDQHRVLFKNCRVRWVDNNGAERYSVPVPEPAEKFHLEHLETIILLGKDSVYRVSLQKGILELEVLNHGVFYDQIRLVKDTLDKSILYSTYDSSFPAFEYKLHHPKVPKDETLRYMEDEFTMSLLRSQWKYLSGPAKAQALRLEQELGVDKEIIAAYMSGFQQSIYYQDIYAPLIRVKDTLLVFDHPDHLLARYSLNGELMDSSSFHYHLKKHPLKWGNEILFDKVEDKIYTYQKHWGNVEMIKLNLKTAAEEGAMPLSFSFVEKIRVNNGWVYYTYRPYESATHRYLYRQPLQFAME
jgi:hypothetical protein